MAFASLPKEEMATLVNSMHKEVRAGCELIGTAASEEMEKILEGSRFSEKRAYLDSARLVTVGGAYSGYFISLLVQNINPTTSNLKARKTTEQLGSTWVEGYEKDEYKHIIEKLDSLTISILRHAADIKIDQLLALCPSVVNLPYRVTERLNEYVKWCTYQGYVLGHIEHSLSPT